MKKVPLLTYSIFLFAIYCLLLATAHAGGPFMVDYSGNGNIIKWPDKTLRWYVVKGALSHGISNEKAVSWLNGIFEIWQNAAIEDGAGNSVKAVDISIEFGGYINVEVDGSNYLQVVKEREGGAVIIFDASGEIIDRQLGENARRYVIGLTSPISNGASFVGGMVVMNGLFINGSNDDVADVSEDEFRAAMLHETGHLLNLDHTQANIEAAKRYEEGDRLMASYVPTMYPVLYSADQLKLSTDDVIALAEQYPSQDYLKNFCRINGELRDINGDGFQGADVVARAKDAAYEWEDVRTFVSGVNYPPGSQNGGYSLAGLVPGREYAVGFRGIDPSFTGGSGLAPYDPPISNIVPSIIADGVVACTSGGTSSDTGVSKVDVSESQLSSNFNTDAGSADGALDAAAPSAGCSLIRRF